MTAFAAYLKTSNSASVDEAPDLQVLKLNHLFVDDEVGEHEFRKASGKEKHMNWIFLRPDAGDVWDHIYSRLLDKPETRVAGGLPPKSQAFLTVSGNSGIGKSYSIIYVPSARTGLFFMTLERKKALRLHPKERRRLPSIPNFGVQFF